MVRDSGGVGGRTAALVVADTGRTHEIRPACPKVFLNLMSLQMLFAIFGLVSKLYRDPMGPQQ